MKRKLLLILLIFLISAATSCFNPKDIIQNGICIDWVDFIKFNGNTYTGIYNAILAEPANVAGEIGEVKFKVADVIKDSNYKLKEGDSAFWAKGTKIYSLKGFPDYSLVAVKDVQNQNGYRLYYIFDNKQPSKWRYKDMPKDRVKRIEIYSKEDSKEGLIKNIDQSSQIKDFIFMLDKGEEIYNPTANETQYFSMIFYTDEIFAYKYTLCFDGINYYWSPWDTKLLPKEFSSYIK